VTDLSELNHSGVAPLPKKGQSKAEFVDEQLTPLGITWEQFAATTYFKDHEDAFRDMLAQDSKSDAKPETQTADDSGKSEAMQKATAQNEKPFEKVDPPPIATEHKPHTEAPSLHTATTKTIPALTKVTPPIKGAFLSKMNITGSTRDMFFFQSASGLEFVPDPDPAMAPLGLLAWLRKQLSDYDGIFVGIKNEWNDSDRSMKTQDGSAGFGIRPFIENGLHEEIKSVYLPKWRRISPPINPVKVHHYDRQVHFYGLPAEFRFQQSLHALGQQNLFEIEDYYQFHKLWDSAEERLIDLPRTIILQKTRVWMDHDFYNYDVLMDTNPSFRDLVYQYVNSHIVKGLAVSAISDRVAIAGLLKNMMATRNQLSHATEMPDEVNKADCIKTIHQMMTILQMTRWFEGGLRIAVNVGSVPMIIGMILIRALTPRRMWSESAILDMDNYLAYWFIAVMPFFKGSLSIDRLYLEVNLMDEVLNDGSLWTDPKILASFRTFFRNWSDSGRSQAFPLISPNGDKIPKEIQNVHRTIRLWHREEVCYSTTNRALMIREAVMDFTQLKALHAMLSVVQSKGAKTTTWGHALVKELREPLLRLLAELPRRQDELDTFQLNFNRANRYLSLHTLTGAYQVNGKWEQIEKRSIGHIFDPTAFTKMFFFLKAETIKCTDFTSSFYESSLSVHHLCADLGDGLHMAMRYMTDPARWTKLDKIKQATEFMKPHPLKSFLVEEFTEKRRIFKFDFLRHRPSFSQKVAAAERFFKELGVAEKQYLESFIYSNGQRKDVMQLNKDDVFNFAITAKIEKKIPSVDVFQLEDLIVKGRLMNFLSSKGPIRLNIPIALKRGTLKDLVFSPLSIASGGKVGISNISVAFEWADIEKRDYPEEFAFMQMPEYFSEKVPWNRITVGNLLANHIHIFHVWSELDLTLVFKRVPVRAAPGSMQ
jgi:hypothetical protein